MSATTDYANGWDVIMASKQKNINAGLKKAYDDGKLIKNFTYQAVLEFFGQMANVNLTGDFDAMQMAGGSGAQMILLLPVQSGTITVGSNSFPLTGITISVTVDLSYAIDPAQPAQGSTWSIVLDLAAPNAIYDIQLQNVPAAFQPYTDGLKVALLSYFRAPGLIPSYAIASVDLGASAKDYPYLVPTLFDCAISADGTLADNNVFAIRMLTTSTAKGKADVISGTVTTDSDAALIISNQILMSKIILPAVAQGFGVQESQLTATGNPVVITSNGEITIPNQPYDPKITSLTIQVLNGHLDFSLVVKATPSPGIHVAYTVHAAYDMTVTTNGSGQEITLTQVTFENTHQVEIEWWVWVVGTVGLIVLLPVITVIGVVIGAAISASIIAILQAVVNTKAPNLSASMFAVAAKPVTWSYGSAFQIQSILLPGPAQVLGTIPMSQSTVGVRSTKAVVGKEVRQKVGV
jgi:hypothetical protein